MGTAPLSLNDVSGAAPRFTCFLPALPAVIPEALSDSVMKSLTIPAPEDNVPCSSGTDSPLPDGLADAVEEEEDYDVDDDDEGKLVIADVSLPNDRDSGMAK